MLLHAPARRAHVQSRVIAVGVFLVVGVFLAIQLVALDSKPQDHAKQDLRAAKVTRDTVVDVVNQMSNRVLALEQKLGSLEAGAVRMSNASDEAVRKAERIDTGHAALKNTLASATDRLTRLEQAAARLEAKLGELDLHATRAATSLRDADANAQADHAKLTQLESKISALLSEVHNVRTEAAGSIVQVHDLAKRFGALSDQTLSALEAAKGRLTAHQLVRVVLVGHDEAPEAGRTGLAPADKLFRWSAGQDSNFDVGRYGRRVVAATICADKAAAVLPAQLSVFDLGPGHCYLEVDVNHVEIMSRPRATGVYVLTLSVTHTD